MKGLSFSQKLFLLVLLTCTGAIAIVGSYSFYHAKRSIMERTFEQLTSVRVIKQKHLETFFGDRLRETAMFAASGLIPHLVKAWHQADNMNDHASESLTHLQEYLGDGAYCEQMLLLFPEGKNIRLYPAISRDIGFPDLPKMFDETDRSRQVTIIDLADHDSGIRRLLITSPVYGNNNVSAMLIMEISAAAINRIMFNESGLQGLGNTGETFLVGTDLAMRTPSRFDMQSNLNMTVDTEATRKAIAGKEGTMVITDYRGIEVLSSFSKLSIPGIDWVICAEIDLKEATIPVYRIRNNILLVSAGTGVFVLLIITLISRMLTKPIVNLMQATDEIGSGRFDTRVLPESTDEIGKLTLAFNRMARQLQQKASALKKEKSQRIRSVLDGQEIERQRLSRELHDGLGQSLIALKLRLESLEFGATAKTRKAIEELRKSFDIIIDEVRRISNNLMPAALHEFGLENALRNHCEELSAQTGIKLLFRSSGNHVELNRKTKTYLYRITQEALINVVKHAKASHVNVSLLKEAGSVQLVIEDDGRGINREKKCKNTGNGLYNIRERVNLLQGAMEIRSGEGKGTTIRIHLPLN